MKARVKSDSEGKGRVSEGESDSEGKSEKRVSFQKRWFRS